MRLGNISKLLSQSDNQRKWMIIITIHSVLDQKMKNFRLVLAIAIATFGMVQPAMAAKSIATFYGKISNGFDRTGVFGSSETSLDGAYATFAFLFDDATPGAYFNINPTASQLSGGSLYGIASPGSAVVTINGVAVPIAGSYQSYAARHNGGYDEIDYFAQDYAGTSSGESNWVHGKISSSTNNFITTTDFNGAFIYDVAPGTDYLADFQFYNPGVGFVGSVQAYGKMAVSRVTVQSLIPAVPEPATWLMMISGFALIGTALRSRRRKIIPTLGAAS
jgi:hypothetical protein